MSDRFCIERLPAERLCNALEHPGAVALPVLRSSYRERLLADARLYPYRPARKEVGRDHQRVQQRMDVEPNIRPDGLFVELTHAFQELFDRSFAHSGFFQEPVNFNDLMLQRYTVGDIGITPHMDRTSYRSIVVLFVLCGRGRFCVAPDRTGAQATEIPNGPGDMILMRAPGFTGTDGIERPRPFHFVDRISEPRYVFGLRDDVEKRQSAR